MDLVPIFGGDQVGLVGADEPRYAQIAREMLEAHSQVCHRYDAKVVPRSLRLQDIQNSLRCLDGGTVTPILYGHPWLEKPALYYWRAMSFFKEFGISDWSARLPSSSATFLLIAMIFLHMRRFRPGGQLDAALITASCVAIIGFARGASTDMQLAAPFCVGMLGWYAWYETGLKFWLFDLYFFGAAATLAKGPVAPFLALGIILLFLGLRREWSVLRRTIWWPGILLYLVMVLPWYIAVQRENPTFVEQFIVQHNLRALRHRSLPAPSAVLVLPRGHAGRPDALDGDRASRVCRGGEGLDRRVEGALQPEALSRTLPRRRRLPRVSCALGPLSHHLLHLLQIEVARVHSAVDPSAHHPYRRLPESHPQSRASQVAAVVARQRSAQWWHSSSCWPLSTWCTTPSCLR